MVISLHRAILLYSVIFLKLFCIISLLSCHLHIMILFLPFLIFPAPQVSSLSPLPFFPSACCTILNPLHIVSRSYDRGLCVTATQAFTIWLPLLYDLMPSAFLSSMLAFQLLQYRRTPVYGLCLYSLGWRALPLKFAMLSFRS